MKNIEKNRVIGLFILRALLGIIFMMQGYGKVFTWGIYGVYENGFALYTKWLPEWLLWAIAYYTSYVELIGGFLLIIGLFRDYTLYAFGLLLLIVSFGHGLSQPIWDLQHVFFRSVMLITLLVLPQEWDKWRLDSLRKK